MINLRVVGEFFFHPPTQAGNATIAALHAEQESYTAQNANTINGVEAKIASESAALNPAKLLERAYQVLDALEQQNFFALSSYVHPEKGVTFTPYSTVDSTKDRTFRPVELSKARSNGTVYVWGLRDGNGLPIQMTVSDYFKHYVYNTDYRNAPMIGVNTVLSSGNALENVAEAYPDGYFVEFYFPGLSTESMGFDWCGLKLVFEPYGEVYYLVAAIHSQWTS